LQRYNAALLDSGGQFAQFDTSGVLQVFKPAPILDSNYSAIVSLDRCSPRPRLNSFAATFHTAQQNIDGSGSTITFFRRTECQDRMKLPQDLIHHGFQNRLPSHRSVAFSMNDTDGLFARELRLMNKLPQLFRCFCTALSMEIESGFDLKLPSAQFQLMPFSECQIADNLIALQTLHRVLPETTKQSQVSMVGQEFAQQVCA
jgi:hypothetical protein